MHEEEYPYPPSPYCPPSYPRRDMPYNHEYYPKRSIPPYPPPVRGPDCTPISSNLTDVDDDHQIDSYGGQAPEILHKTSKPETSDEACKHRNSEETCKKKVKDAKKPPRPYTEYNIFFQLERERILAELESEKQKENAKDGKTEDLEESSRITKELNQPSDPNDILPRPPQFAHLRLGEYWYDSTYRLRQSKHTKSRRKHRKTHGLVGFLDLTRRIAKAWSEADEATKGYCKKVANRQLKTYKEELKKIKKETTAEVEAAKEPSVPLPPRLPPQEPVEATVSGPRYAPPPPLPKVPSYPLPPPMEYGHRGALHPEMPPPPPMPQPRPPIHYGHNKYEGVRWHQEPPDQRMIRERPRPPSIPALSPAADYTETPYAVEGSSVHPLEELMNRRKIYGTKAMAMNQNKPPRSRKDNSKASLSSTPIMPTLSNSKSNADEDNKIEETKENNSAVNSYLSPANTENTKSKNGDSAAITPSPNTRVRKNSQERKEENLPMKKRHKKMEDDTDFSPGSFASGSPGSAISQSFFSSPFENIMTPREGGEPLMSSPSDASYQRALETFIGDSPFPYIDAHSPYVSQRKGSLPYHSPGAVMPPYPQTIHRAQPLMSSPGVPPHFNVPSTAQQNSPFRFPSTSFDNWVNSDANDDMSDTEGLDLDEEEMQAMWKKLKSHAKRKRQLAAAAAWNNISEGCDPSPGFPLPSHSFSSPTENNDASVEKK